MFQPNKIILGNIIKNCLTMSKSMDRYFRSEEIIHVLYNIKAIGNNMSFSSPLCHTVSLPVFLIIFCEANQPCKINVWEWAGYVNDIQVMQHDCAAVSRYVSMFKWMYKSYA